LASKLSAVFHGGGAFPQTPWGPPGIFTSSIHSLPKHGVAAAPAAVTSHRRRESSPFPGLPDSRGAPSRIFRCHCSAAGHQSFWFASLGRGPLIGSLRCDRFSRDNHLHHDRWRTHMITRAQGELLPLYLVVRTGALVLAPHRSPPWANHPAAATRQPFMPVNWSVCVTRWFSPGTGNMAAGGTVKAKLGQSPSGRPPAPRPFQPARH